MTDKLVISDNQFESFEQFSLPFGEIFAKEIIEKLISYTVTETYKMEIEKSLNGYTFDYLKSTLHNLLEINYITRERDDKDMPKSQLIEDDLFTPQSKYYYTNLYFGFNDWNEIAEPLRPKIERGASTLIKLVKSSNLQIDRDDVIPENTNIKLEQSNIESTKNNTKIYVNKKMILRPKTIDVRVAFDDREIPEWPVETEDMMIKQMREDKFKDIKKKLVEEEERIKLQLEKERDALKIETLKPKEVDGKKFTFDVNGASIIMKDIDIDKLGLDFCLPSFKRYDVKEKPAAINTASVKFNNLQNNTAAIIVNPSIDKKSNMNSEYYDNLDKQKRKQSRPDIMNFTKMPPERERVSVQPAGSNYDLISPETGVTLIEGNKSKSGSTDYHLKFGKYSKYDYSVMLKQLVNKSLPNITHINNNNNTSLMSKDNSTIIINKSTINPLANYNDSLIDNTFNSVMENNFNSINTSDYSRHIRMNNVNESAKISSKFANGLKSTFDSLFIIPELGEKIAEVSPANNVSDLMLSEKLKYRNGPRSSRIKSEPLDLMNRFNMSIIKNRKWGLYDDGHVKAADNRKHPKKLKKNVLDKEVETNVLKVKLPRSRVYNPEKNKIEHLK